MHDKSINKVSYKLLVVLVSLALFCSALIYAPVSAFAQGTTATTGVYLKAIENPFYIESQEILVSPIGEGDDKELTGSIIYNGRYDVSYYWQVSEDGGETWTTLLGATSQTYQITDAKPGKFIYRLVVIDTHKNFAYQDFLVEVIPAPATNNPSNGLSKTGDFTFYLVAGFVLLAAIAALILLLASRRNKKEETCETEDASGIQNKETEQTESAMNNEDRDAEERYEKVSVVEKTSADEVGKETQPESKTTNEDTTTKSSESSDAKDED